MAPFASGHVSGRRTGEVGSAGVGQGHRGRRCQHRSAAQELRIAGQLQHFQSR